MHGIHNTIMFKMIPKLKFDYPNNKNCKKEESKFHSNNNHGKVILIFIILIQILVPSHFIRLKRD